MLRIRLKRYLMNVEERWEDNYLVRMNWQGLKNKNTKSAQNKKGFALWHYTFISIFIGSQQCDLFINYIIFCS